MGTVPDSQFPVLMEIACLSYSQNAAEKPLYPDTS